MSNLLKRGLDHGWSVVNALLFGCNRYLLKALRKIWLAMRYIRLDPFRDRYLSGGRLVKGSCQIFLEQFILTMKIWRQDGFCRSDMWNKGGAESTF